MANGVDKDKVLSCYAQAKQPDDGGPAFPRAGYCIETPDDDCKWSSGHWGMSLHDYFAGQAIVALGCEAIRKMDTANKKQNLPVSLTWEHFAMNAYEIADAMIAQRNKEQGDGS